ncbi:MAG: threonine--tRNA ligase [Clostridia bacterium]|nr:threonine--tRNA ligase [Clostridia bacterium]
MELTIFGEKHQIPEGSSVGNWLKDNRPEECRKYLAVRLEDGSIRDLFAPVEASRAVTPLTFTDEEGRKVFFHSASHLLAMAVKTLFPETKLAIGPAIENGFYYDFDREEAFTAEELQKIEKEMYRLARKGIRPKRLVLGREEAVARMEALGEPYKAELIRDLPEDEPLSFYQMEDFVDLCAGPHVPDVSVIKAMRLTQLAGAYWRGSEKNKMLRRVYGTAFPTREELEAHLEQLEEAKRRDHNRIGRELEYFTTVDYIGQGLPILMPKGAKVIQILERFVEDEEERRGYLLTKTPFMAKRDLYKISGHWDHYRDGMFIMGDGPEEAENDEAASEVFALRPMTCPFQFQVYLNRTRSYRDLPMRLGETSTLFRNESSGEMHGLIRVRQFTISEGHIACLPEQVESEFRGCLELAQYLLELLGFSEDVSYRFSKWDEHNREKYIGDPEGWENSQAMMRKILDDLRVPYVEADGEAAFYGPKLDIQIKNVHGKEDTLITIQIDFQLAQRFGMLYTDRDGEKKFPIVIHRTSIGCYERTLALLLEKYAGALPAWLSPVQVRILTITDRADAFAGQVEDALRREGLRAEKDLRNEKIGFKVREAQLEKIPFLFVIGDRECEERTVTVRKRKGENVGTMGYEDAVGMVRKAVEEKARD